MTQTIAAPAPPAPPAPSAPPGPPPAPPSARRAPGRSSGRIGFGRVALTAVHLAALGVVGTVVISVAVSLLAAGIGAVFALGIGLVILAGLVYGLFGVGWFELERVRALYDLEVGPLRLRRPTRPGFGGRLRALCRQAVDARMWRALASFVIGTLLGIVVLRLVWQLVRSLVAAGGALGGAAAVWMPLGEEGSSWSPPSGWVALFAPLALAAILGVSLLHAVIARALLGRPSRGELAAEVRARSAERAGAVRAADVERTRIERDLHDGVQPRLVSIGMTLGLARQKLGTDPDAARELLDEAHTSTKAAITELRQLARGIHTSVLDDRGLDAALSALAARSPVPVRLDVRMEGRPASEGTFRDAEAAVYFSIAEALTNAAKHSRAGECRVTVRLREPGTPDAVLWARVEDDGVGGAVVQPGGGLDGIANRALAAGGGVRLDSPRGGPTSLEVSVPCAS